ncbi:unnamed protein product [Cercopithifilaria johnstoni]|uniref:Piwi domain-containing protein n=1 Tax=Cercopithifilaria johnstoni TaxID=2874296 RepID=A0A8J2M5N5_9BILA|nr:unnamed protein product [Cercopithifilaria johnstoni]
MNLKEENERRRCRAQIVDENPYLRSLGIHIIKAPCAGEATIQFPPAIVCENGVVEPKPNGDLDWRLSVPRDDLLIHVVNHLQCKEGKQFREAFIAAANGRAEFIRLTILVMQAHPNYLIYPEHIQQGSASQQNVSPGAIIHADIVHPTQTEFIIVAHRVLHVLYVPRLDELEGITNALCYAHGIVTSPISLPAHLYAAADLAKRGRNNFKTEHSGSNYKQCAVFLTLAYIMLSPEMLPMKCFNEFSNKLKCKFWD